MPNVYRTRCTAQSRHLIVLSWMIYKIIKFGKTLILSKSNINEVFGSQLLTCSCKHYPQNATWKLDENPSIQVDGNFLESNKKKKPQIQKSLII